MQLPTWRQECLHHCWSPVSNPLCQVSWLLNGLTLTMHLRLEESYLRQWLISASLTTHGMTRRNRESVFHPEDLWTAKRVLVRADKVQPSLAPKYTGPYRVLHRWRKCFRLQLDNKSDSVSIDRLRPFYEDETPRATSYETVNSSAADDVLPALVSRPRRNLRPPRRLGYD